MSNRDAMQHKRGQSKRVGNIQYGYRPAPGDKKRLEPDPGEQAILVEIRRLRRSGTTLRALRRPE